MPGPGVIASTVAAPRKSTNSRRSNMETHHIDNREVWATLHDFFPLIIALSTNRAAVAFSSQSGRIRWNGIKAEKIRRRARSLVHAAQPEPRPEGLSANLPRLPRRRDSALWLWKALAPAALGDAR